jgi:hypothetical protein
VTNSRALFFPYGDVVLLFLEICFCNTASLNELSKPGQKSQAHSDINANNYLYSHMYGVNISKYFHPSSTCMSIYIPAYALHFHQHTHTHTHTHAHTQHRKQHAHAHAHAHAHTHTHTRNTQYTHSLTHTQHRDRDRDRHVALTIVTFRIAFGPLLAQARSDLVLNFVITILLALCVCSMWKNHNLSAQAV